MHAHTCDVPMPVYVPVPVYLLAYVHVYVYKFVHVRVRGLALARSYAYSCMCVCTVSCVYGFLCVRVYTYMLAYIGMFNTHTNSRSRSFVRNLLFFCSVFCHTQGCSFTMKAIKIVP